MNKTITANLGGINFHLDEIAFEAFKKYLDAIRKSLEADEGREEILQDIEARIAELLQLRLTADRQVVTLQDVDAIRAAMGQPEDFGGGAAYPSGESNETIQAARKLFRDPDDRFFGGVCSGTAAYFGISPLWFRLLFIFLFFGFGTGILLYVILWMVIPKAKTTADKLSMRGEPVNLSTIEKNIKEELDQLKKQTAQGRKHADSFLNRMVNGVGSIIRYVAVAVSKIFAAFFLLIGLLVGFILFAILFAVVTQLPGTSVNLPDIVYSIFNSNTAFIWALVGAVLAVGIPFLAMAWIGARILFKARISRTIGFLALGFWLVGLFLLGWFGVGTAREFNEEGSVRTESILPVSQDSLIVLQLKGDHADQYADRADRKDWSQFVLVDGSYRSDHIKVDIVRSPDQNFHLVKIFYAKGVDERTALKNAGQITYDFERNGNTLLLNPYLSVAETERFRDQRVQLVLQVPNGGRVRLDQSMKTVLYDVSNTRNIYDHDMVGRTWQMTTDGLDCVDCTGSEETVGELPDTLNGIIRIDEHGLSIKGDQGEEILIDSNGIKINGKSGTKRR